jgi:hypothetical protein
VSTAHIIDEGDRWRVIHEENRRRRIFVALIPNDATAADIFNFTATVGRLAGRRIEERDLKHGKAEGASKGEVPGADAAGEAEEKTDPEGRSPEGGEDPKA